MDAQAVEGLAHQRILAEGGRPAEAAAAVGPGELADRQGKAVDDRKRRIMGDARQHALRQALFESPQIGRLPHEGVRCSVHSAGMKGA